MLVSYPQTKWLSYCDEILQIPQCGHAKGKANKISNLDGSFSFQVHLSRPSLITSMTSQWKIQVLWILWMFLSKSRQIHWWNSSQVKLSSGWRLKTFFNDGFNLLHFWRHFVLSNNDDVTYSLFSEISILDLLVMQQHLIKVDR